MRSLATRPASAGAEVVGSLLSPGVVVHGAVERSVLGRNVVIEAGALVRGSVVLDLEELVTVPEDVTLDQLHEVDRHGLQGGQQTRRLMLAPGLDEKLPHLFARWIEHEVSLQNVQFNRGQGSGNTSLPAILKSSLNIG